MMNISWEFEISTYNNLCSRGPKKLLSESRKRPVAAILFFKMRPKIFPGKIYGFATSTEVKLALLLRTYVEENKNYKKKILWL